MSTKRLTTGARVVFELADAICPEFDQIVAQIGPDLTVGGEIALLSDRGTKKEHFAIINVTGLTAPLIVPVEKLRTSRLVDPADVSARPEN